MRWIVGSNLRPWLGRGLAILLFVLGFFLFSGTALWAHHGQDFLLTQTAETPHQGEIYWISRQDFIDEGDEDEIEFEPTFFVGTTDRLALEVHSHIARESGDSFEYESTAPALLFRLSPSDAIWGLAFAAEYEFSNLNDHPDVVEGGLILSRSLQSSLIAFNFRAAEEQESGADIEWSYAVGYRNRLSESMDWGVEFAGGLEERAEHEALLGLFVDSNDRLTVQIGIGTAIGNRGPDLALRTALVWRARRHSK